MKMNLHGNNLIKHFMLKFRSLLVVTGMMAAMQSVAANPILDITAENCPNPNAVIENLGSINVIALSCGDDIYLPVQTSEPIFGSFSISAWYCPSGIPASIKRFTLIGQSSENVSLAYDENKRFSFNVKLSDGSVASTWSRSLPTGRWYHLVGVFDMEKKEITMFVNGKMEHSNRIALDSIAVGSKFNIGCSNPEAAMAYWLNGSINEVKVFNLAINEEDIDTIFRACEEKYSVRPITGADLDAAETQGKPFELLPVFALDAVSGTTQEQYLKEIPLQLSALEKQTQDYKKQFELMFRDIECLQKERIGKRIEIVDHLVEFIKHNFNSTGNDGFMHAVLGINDLKFFQEYFQAELEAWEKYPRIAVSGDPGNNPTILNGADFGMKGDGKTDDGPALHQAVEELKKLEGAPAVLQIPAGTYYLGNNFFVSNLANAIIEGQSPENTKFIFGEYGRCGILLKDCQNVTIANLMVQYEKFPFLQGDILEVDALNNTVTIQHTPGTLSLDDPVFALNDQGEAKFFQACTAYNQNGELVRSQFLVYNDRKYDDLGNGKFKIYMDKRYTVQWLKPGLKFVLPYREGLAPCVVFNDGYLCNAENIYIRNARGAAFQTWGGWWCSWSKCKVYPLDGFCLGSNSDFVIASDGSYLSNCEVINPGDDCFNPHTQGFPVNRTEGNLAFHDPFPGKSRVGQQVRFISTRTGQYVGLAAISALTQWIGDRTATEFETLLPVTIKTRETGGQAGKWQGNLEFRGLIRNEGGADSMYNPYVFGMGSVVYNSVFKHMRSGVLIQAPNSLIENCTFENLPMGAGVTISALIAYGEGPTPYNVIVRNNKIKDAHFGLRTQVLTRNGEPASCPSIWGIVFENNICEDTAYPIYFRNLGNSIVEGLEILGHSKHTSKFGEKDNQVWIERSYDVTFKDTTINGDYLNLEEAEVIQSRDIQVVR